MHTLFSSFSLGAPRLSIAKLSQHADHSQHQGYCLSAEPSCIGISTCHFLYKESDLKSLSLSQLVQVHSPFSLVTTIQTTPTPINQYKTYLSLSTSEEYVLRHTAYWISSPKLNLDLYSVRSQCSEELTFYSLQIS